MEFVPATVAASLSENFEGLLGMDFITTFKVKIDSAQQVLILTLPQPDPKEALGGCTLVDPREANFC